MGQGGREAGWLSWEEEGEAFLANAFAVVQTTFIIKWQSEWWLAIQIVLKREGGWGKGEEEVEREVMLVKEVKLFMSVQKKPSP